MRSLAVDLDLTTAVERFVAAVAPAFGRLRADIADLRSVQPLRDALEVTRAFIDVDGLYSDEELQAFIDTFGSRVEGSALSTATPRDLRADDVFRRARAWLDEPSALFDLLVQLDRREGSDYSWRYHDAATALVACVFSLDGYRSPAETGALDRWRTVLLGIIHGAGIERHEARRPPPRPTERTLDTAEETSLADLLGQLDELVGLEPVKRQVRQVSDLLKVQRLRGERGMAQPDTSHHLVFTGNPGTGKTTVARLVAQIYRALGVVSRGHVVETDRAGLVAGFVGQTAGQVDEVVEEALGGVLLIDEAYGLVRGGAQDYGREALDALVKRMEDHRDDLVVIVAGYPDEMDDFLDANPGLRSRFPRVIHFPDYRDEELVAIFELCCRADDYRPSAGALERLNTHLAQLERGRGFGNGRLARTMFEHGILAHATRVAGLGAPTDEDLSTLLAEDIAC